jgi:hypothetical protein
VRRRTLDSQRHPLDVTRLEPQTGGGGYPTLRRLLAFVLVLVDVEGEVGGRGRG